MLNLKSDLSVAHLHEIIESIAEEKGRERDGTADVCVISSKFWAKRNKVETRVKERRYCCDVTGSIERGF